MIIAAFVELRPTSHKSLLGQEKGKLNSMTSNNTHTFGFPMKFCLTVCLVLCVVSTNASYRFPEGDYVVPEGDYLTPEGDYPLPECKRWTAEISCEEFHGGISQCSPAQNTSTAFYKALYHNTAQAACEKTAEINNQMGAINAVPSPNNPDDATCTVNGANWTSVSNDVIAPEDLCSYKVSGRYSVFPDFPFTTADLAPNSNASQTYYGSEWNTTQRLNIRHKNRQLRNEPIRSLRLFSDINFNKVKYSNAPRWKAIPDHFRYLTEDQSKPNAGVIHHIIPLIDRKGCKCGTNSYKNAVVISKKTNEEKSNDTTNEILLKIIARYRVF
jgi:hypothetical protein